MNVRLTAAQLGTLDDGEAAEFVALIRKVEQDEHGQRSTNLMRLSWKERARLETLVEACIENPGYFQHQRQQADSKATLEVLARKSRRPHRRGYRILPLTDGRPRCSLPLAADGRVGYAAARWL